MIKIYFLSLLSDTPKRGYWDYALLEDLLPKGEVAEVESIPEGDFGIVVLPARSHHKEINRVNRELSKLKSVLLFLMGDEEAVFPVSKIKHNNILIWVQNPDPKLDPKHRKLGCGYPPQIHNNVDNPCPDKTYDWFFSGQMTHIRRYLCVNKLCHMDNGFMHTSEGFTLGIPQNEYYDKMSHAKVAPCPSGPVTVDTFRLFEALELGLVPIADNETPSKDWTGFWRWIFEEDVPFPTLNKYDDLPGYVSDCVAKYPALNNRVQAWWMRKKMQIRHQIEDDIFYLYGQYVGNEITAIVPVSPIPSHPDTKILEETIKSIRHHLSNSQIILCFDGVRAEMEDRRGAYEEHIRRILWMCRKWDFVTPYIFDEHKHQSGMMRAVINDVKSPVVLFVEQDTPLVTDYEIPFSDLSETIIMGDANVIRFHHEARIPKEHSHMMIGDPELELQKTIQWSQRPHLASRAFYRRIMSDYFTDNSRCFLEDLLHGKLLESYALDNKLGWDQWRTFIYHPSGNIKRSYHTDGRAGAKKYDETQVWR